MHTRDEDEDADESEMLSDRHRHVPLIVKSPVDNFTKIALSAMVALTAFLLGFAYNGNRELGVLAESVRQNTLATDRRINALEIATDRRLTALENRLERLRYGNSE